MADSKAAPATKVASPAPTTPPAPKATPAPKAHRKAHHPGQPRRQAWCQEKVKYAIGLVILAAGCGTRTQQEAAMPTPIPTVVGPDHRRRGSGRDRRAAAMVRLHDLWQISTLQRHRD